MTSTVTYYGETLTYAEFAKQFNATEVGVWLVFGSKTKPAPGLTSIGGWADLRRYEHPLPALVSIGEWADLRGYGHPLPGLTSIVGSAKLGDYEHATWPWFIPGGPDERGYWFSGHYERGEWRVHAGCRNFTTAEALAHWGPGGKSNRRDCLAIVQRIAAEAQRRETSP